MRRLRLKKPPDFMDDETGIELKVMDDRISNFLRSVTDNWNIQTHNWVKYVCYDRTPASIK